MSEPKFMPGPWKLESTQPIDGSFAVYNANATGIIAHRGMWSLRAEESMANAHLIAAAPELYRALELFVSIANLSARLNNPCLFTNEDYAVVTAKNALAKARGEQ